MSMKPAGFCYQEIGIQLTCHSSRNASKGSNTGLLVIFALIALAGAGFGYSWWSSHRESTTAGTADEKRANMPEPIFMGI